MLDVFALSVRLSEITENHCETFIILAPSVNVLLKNPLQIKKPLVVVCPLVSRLPSVKVILDVQLFNVSCNVHQPHVPLNVIADAKTTVLQVIVFPVEVDLNVIQPVYVLVIPLTSERLPYIFNAVDPAHVGAPTSGFPQVMSAQNASLSIVTV